MVGVIIQARMGSTRLPGKTMKKIMDKPLLYYSVKRSSLAKYVDKVIVATTTENRDDKIVTWCEKNNIDYYRGSEDDVLDRYYKAAMKYNLNKVVRVTSDDPFIDPQLIDMIILYSLNFDYDYVTLRYKTNTWPYGLDVEVYSIEALEKSSKEATKKEEREHVSPYIRNHSDKFSIFEIPFKEELADIRLTVDYEEDFKAAEYMIEQLLTEKGINFTWKHVVDLILKN